MSENKGCRNYLGDKQLENKTQLNTEDVEVTVSKPCQTVKNKYLSLINQIH